MQKLETQTDYWLAQYQRLLDSKPQSLIDQVLLTHHVITLTGIVFMQYSFIEMPLTEFRAHTQI